MKWAQVLYKPSLLSNSQTLLKVIAKKKGGRNTRGRGGRARGAGASAGKRTVSASDPRGRYAGASPSANGRQASTLVAVASPASVVPGDGTKIIVSNLPEDVNEPMVRVSHLAIFV